MATNSAKNTPTSTNRAWFGGRSIQNRLLLLVGLVLVVAVALSLRSTLRLLDQSSAKEAERALQDSKKSLQLTVLDEVRNLEVQSQLLSSLPILRAVLDTRDISTIRDTAKDYRKELQLDVVDLYDSRGKFLTSVGEVSEAQERAGLQELIRLALKGKPSSGWMMTRGRVALVVAGPVGEGQLSGVTVLGLLFDDARAAQLGQMVRGDLEFSVAGNVVSSTQRGMGFADNADFQSASWRVEPLLGAASPELHLYLSRAAVLATRKQVRNVVLVEAMVILAASALLALWVARSVSRPVLRLKETATKILESNSLSHRAEVNGSDEVAELGRVFNHLLSELEKRNAELEEYNRTLEQKVAERTAELNEANFELSMLLDNLDQGYLTFDDTGMVGRRTTRATSRHFGVDPAGLSFADALNRTDSEKAAISEVLQMASLGVMQFEDLGPLLPKHFDNPEGRRIEFEYRQMKDGDGQFLGKFICIASDKTEENEYRRIAEREQAQTKMVIRALAHREAFIEVVHESLLAAEELRTNLAFYGLKHEGGLTWYQNQIHTLKGNLASYSLEGPAKALHLLETQIEELKDKYDRETLESIINLGFVELDLELTAFVRDFGTVLGVTEGGVQPSRWVLQSELDRLYELVAHQAVLDQAVVAQFRDRYILEDIESLFGRFDRVVQELAPRWSKEVRLAIHPSEIRLRSEKYRGVLKALVHVFRNAVVHGIEFPEDRTNAGKLREGTIEVHLENSVRGEGWVRWRIRDDGAGIPIEKLKMAAIAAGVVDQARIDEMSQEELLRLVLLPAVSTAEQVTDAAGRGFGLSALATEVREMGGSLDVRSVEGQWTEFSFDLPRFQST